MSLVYLLIAVLVIMAMILLTSKRRAMATALFVCFRSVDDLIRY